MPFLIFILLLLSGCGSKTVRFEREPGSVPRPTAIIFVPSSTLVQSTLAEVTTAFSIPAWCRMELRASL